jgi:hypothetical protein
MTKTVRSRFNHEVGQQVEGCTILEKRVIIPPNPEDRRLGVYDYLVEAPPVVAKPVRATQRVTAAQRAATAAAPASPSSYTRTTPEEMSGRVIRRIPSR